MKNFKTYLAELWDEPYPRGKLILQKSVDGGNIRWYVVSVARLPNGKVLEIGFMAVVPQGLPMNESSWEIMFTVDGSIELTNDASTNPFKVLSTVVEATKKFLEWHKREHGDYPRHILMPSKKTDAKRDIIYKALVNKFGPDYGFKRTYNARRDSKLKVTAVTRDL